MEEDLFDEDGYPSEEALKRVETWNYKDGWRPWFEFIKKLWRYPDWCTSEDVEGGTVTNWDISTGGWSGNEDVIRAMQANKFMWTMTWVQSRRGGHYTFEVKAVKHIEPVKS